MSSLFRRKRQEEKGEDEAQHVVERRHLKDMCADEEMYYAASRSLYLEPDRQLPDTPIESLISDAEEAHEKGEDKRSFWKFRLAFDKAVFEATRHKDERERYSNVAKESISEALAAAERLRAKGQITGLEDLAKAMEILRRRLGEFIDVASHYYSEGPHR